MASKKRVICGLSVAAVWLAAIFLLPTWGLALALMGGALVCLYELCAMLRKAGYRVPFVMLAVATTLWFAGMYGAIFGTPDIQGQPNFEWLGLLLPIVVVAMAFGVPFGCLLRAKLEKPMETMALTAFAFFYVPVLLSLFLAVVASATTHGDCACEYEMRREGGIFLALALVVAVKMCDTGGYFIGSAFGKHKMCPRLSPGKSWEGTLGGYLFAFAATGGLVALAHAYPKSRWLITLYHETATGPRMAWFFATIAVVVTVGILGDLLESLFKRQCGVKDSSALFPAMGGFFDTFDSVIFVPAAYLVMMVLGKAFL